MQRWGDATAGVSRTDEPVLVLGESLPDMLGREIGDIGLYRWDVQKLAFVPIPFQIDERVDHVFNPEVPPLRFVETIYDVFGEEQEILDENDEFAFMYRDVGVRAPAEAPWPEWADPVRYEIRIEDPRPGSSVSPRWVYAYSGPAPPRSDDRYVTWNGANDGSIETGLFELDFEGNWLLTGYRVGPPCGDGTDLIDRWKGRARPRPELYEDEEGWNTNSTYLGGLVGPIRAIRYVRGATSGINTIHHDIVYDSYWFRRINLRVHPIEDAWVYFDWTPRPGVVFFSQETREGVAVDGLPDSSVTDQDPDWHVIAGQGGGMAIAYEVPPVPQYDELEGFYVDDADYDDAIITNPGYGDEDDSAYGSFGKKVIGVGESNVSPVTLDFNVYPICEGEGSALVGDTIEEFEAYPLEAQPFEQWITLGPVRSLEVRVQGSDVVLEWQSVPAADNGYRVYAAPDPSLPEGDWPELGVTSSTSYLDAGAGLDPQLRCYSVVALGPDGIEGPW